MTHKYNLFRKAQGTNSEFHLDGKKITCEIQTRSGIGQVYCYSTNDPREASRLQIVHGFKIDVRAILPNIDRAQVAELSKSEPPVQEKPKKTRARRKPRAKKNDT